MRRSASRISGCRVDTARAPSCRRTSDEAWNRWLEWFTNITNTTLSTMLHSQHYKATMKPCTLKPKNTQWPMPILPQNHCPQRRGRCDFPFSRYCAFPSPLVAQITNIHFYWTNHSVGRTQVSQKLTRVNKIWQRSKYHGFVYYHFVLHFDGKFKL